MPSCRLSIWTGWLLLNWPHTSNTSLQPSLLLETSAAISSLPTFSSGQPSSTLSPEVSSCCHTCSAQEQLWGLGDLSLSQNGPAKNKMWKPLFVRLPTKDIALWPFAVRERAPPASLHICREILNILAKIGFHPYFSIRNLSATWTMNTPHSILHRSYLEHGGHHRHLEDKF